MAEDRVPAMAGATDLSEIGAAGAAGSPGSGCGAGDTDLVQTPQVAPAG